MPFLMDLNYVKNYEWNRSKDQFLRTIFHSQFDCNFIVIKFLGTLSLQYFAHAMTAWLSWHVQNFVVITSFEFGWEETEISIKN